MEEILRSLDWSVIGASLAGSAITLILGLIAYAKIPQKDMGASALATVQAGRQAMEMQEESYRGKVDDLEERVSRLELLVVEKDKKILELELVMTDERRKFHNEMKRMMRWIDALVEQVAKLGGVPITLEEIEHLDKFRGEDFRKGRK